MVLGGVVLSAVVVSGVAVQTTYRFLLRELARSMPVSLSRAELRLNQGLDDARADLQAALPEPAASPSPGGALVAIQPLTEGGVMSGRTLEQDGHAVDPKCCWQPSNKSFSHIQSR